MTKNATITNRILEYLYQSARDYVQLHQQASLVLAFLGLPILMVTSIFVLCSAVTMPLFGLLDFLCKIFIQS